MRLIASLLERSASAVIQDSSPVFLGLPQIDSEPHVAPLEQQGTLEASGYTNTGAHPVVEWGNWGRQEGRAQLEVACTEEQLTWCTITTSLLSRFSLRKWEPLLEMRWTALLEKVWWWPIALSWDRLKGVIGLVNRKPCPCWLGQVEPGNFPVFVCLCSATFDRWLCSDNL